MKKSRLIPALAVLLIGVSSAFAFSPKPFSVLYSPTYNGSGQITGWTAISGSYHCNLNPNRICTATFQDDDPSKTMLSSTKGNFVQP